MQVLQILETSLYVDDLARAERFYVDILGLALVSKQEGRHVFLRCGRQMLLLFNPLGSRETDGQFPSHGAFGPGHVAFSASERSLEMWSAQLAKRGVAIERVLDWPQGGRSLYFRDTAGNSVELATPRIWGLSEDSV